MRPAALEEDLCEDLGKDPSLAIDFGGTEVLHEEDELAGDLFEKSLEGGSHADGEVDLGDEAADEEELGGVGGDVDNVAAMHVDSLGDLAGVAVRDARRARDLVDDLSERVFLVVPEDDRPWACGGGGFL